MSNEASSQHRWKLLLLGIALVILVFASMALSAFISVDLILQGLRDGQAGSLLVGLLLAAMWILMLYKTATARRPASAA